MQRRPFSANLRGIGAIAAAALIGTLLVSSNPRAGQSPAPGGAAPAAQTTPPPPIQPARPTFRANIEAVQLDLRVLDRKGQFVPDLAQNEFRVFEDGVEQTITNFELIDLPIEPPESTVLNRRIVDPDTASNSHRDGRIYVIVLDDLEDQVNNPLRSRTVREIAREFIEHHMTDVDQAALVTTSGRGDMAQDFTSNRQRLIDATNKYEGGYGQRNFTLNNPGSLTAAMVPDNLHSAMVSLTSMAKWMSQIDGRRKSIVMVSERLGRAITPLVGDDFAFKLASDEAQDVKDFVTAAARGNVSLYILDPVGVPTGAAGAIKPIQPDVDDPSAFENDRIQSLVTLAEATGGFAAVRSNNFVAALDRIVHESSSYYLLGYVSSNPRTDGKFRKVEVRTTRPDLTVHARSGYVAPTSTANAEKAKAIAASGLPPAISDLLKNPLGVAGMPLTISAPVFRSGNQSKGAVVVVVEAGANRLLFSEASTRFNAGMTLAIAAADKSGKIQAGERGALTMRLSPQTREAVAARGARVVSQLELKPGRYQLKVAAIDSSDGATKGSVLYDLDVPDFAKIPLGLSGVALSSPNEDPVPTVARDPKLKDLLGDFPTARRDFTRFEELRVYVEAYDNDKRPAHAITVTTTVRAADSGNSVFNRRVVLSRDAAKDAIHRLTTNIPLSDLGTGRYVLSVEARSGNDADKIVVREVPFSVR